MTEIDSSAASEIGNASERPTRAVVALCLAVGSGLILWALPRGFDLTDESYYVALIVDPDRYAAAIHLFGLPFHLLFDMLGGSIVGLRLVGLLLVTGSGALLGRALARYYGRATDGAWLVPSGALFGLANYNVWFLTPNYNMLANVAGALVMTGALGWATANRDEAAARDGIASWLVAIGGALAFFAKPPFATVLAIGVAIMIAASIRPVGRRLAAIRAAIAGLGSIALVLAVTHVTISIPSLIGKLQLGLNVLDFGNSVTRLPVKTMREILAGPPILFVALTGLVFTVVLGRRDDRSGDGLRLLNRGMLALTGVYFPVSVALAMWRGLPIAWDTAVPAISLAIAFVSHGIARNPGKNLTLGQLIPLAVLLALPVATAIGTANSLFHQTCFTLYPVLFAVVLGGQLLHTPVTARRVHVAAAILTLFLLFSSAHKPYGLSGTILDQTEPLALDWTDDSLRVDARTKAYVEGLRAIARRERLQPGTPILDLSGGGPGTALFLNQGAPFFPWLVPNYASSVGIVNAAWGSLAPTERARAWIVGPVDDRLKASAPARGLAGDAAAYRSAGTLDALFWGKPKRIELWVPARPAPRARIRR